MSRSAQKTSEDNKLDSTLKRRGRRKGSKVESSNHSIVGLKKRQINESEKVKRGQQRDSPLTELEKDLAHPDQHLAPTDKSPHDLVSFSSVLISELQNQVIEKHFQKDTFQFMICSLINNCNQYSLTVRLKC